MSKNKHSDLGANATIRDAIRKIALRGIVNNSTGAVRGTGRVSGYVAKIHDDESDELFGTVDVQEYIQLAVDESGDMQMGYHEGVLLSAIQDNSKGYVIIPKLYSEVLVSKDSDSGTEYVSMYSHVDFIQLDAHETISIGVKEREEWEESEDSPDIDELEETGIFTNTTYLKDSINSEVHGAKDSHITKTEMTGEKMTASIDDDQTTVEIDKEQIHMKRENAEVSIKTDEIVEEVGSSSITIEDGTVHLGSTSNTDNAVLGKELATILSELSQYLGQMMTPTMMGPQPPANVVASFISLKAKIDAFKAGQNGFLTQKVMVQK